MVHSPLSPPARSRLLACFSFLCCCGLGLTGRAKVSEHSFRRAGANFNLIARVLPILSLSNHRMTRWCGLVWSAGSTSDFIFPISLVANRCIGYLDQDTCTHSRFFCTCSFTPRRYIVPEKPPLPVRSGVMQPLAAPSHFGRKRER